MKKRDIALLLVALTASGGTEVLAQEQTSSTETIITSSTESSAASEPSTTIESSTIQETIESSETIISEAPPVRVQAPPNNEITGAVDKTNLANGQFDITLSPTNASDVKAVRVAIWSHPRQQNLRWYQATRQADGTYSVHFDYKDHQYLVGNYHIHVYTTTIDNKETSMALPDVAVAQPENTNATFSAQQLNPTTYRLSLSLQNPNVKGVTFPTWSDNRGQDDIRWYTAKYDATLKIWYADVPIANHPDAGKMITHSYVETASSSIGLRGDDYTFPELTIESTSIEQVDEKNGKFQVRIVVDNPSLVSKVEIPVWSHKNGQDDLRWYQAVKQEDGSYMVEVDYKNHKYDVGRYLIHAYAHSINGQSKSVAVSNNFQVKEPVLGGELIIVPKESDPTKYIASIKLDSSVDGIQFPTWTEKGGQDDIRWYSGVYDATSGTWKAEIDLKSHPEGGKIQTHVWATQAGKMKFVTHQAYSVEGAAMTNQAIDVSQANKGKIKVTLTVDNPDNVKNIQLPIWSNKNGQDDLVWYDATKQADGTFTVDFDTKNHKFDTGRYLIHAYIHSKNGITRSFAVNNNLVIPEFKLDYQDLKVERIDDRNGIYRLSVQVENSDRVKGVQFPTWTQTNGQDDIRWYQAKRNAQTNSWSIDVKLRDNHFNGTKLNVHAYADLVGTGLYGMGGTSIDLPELGVSQMVNHRGNHKNAPENSIPSFENANYYAAETDIQLTSDNRWVIMHDGTIDRMTNGSGQVSKMTFDQLRKYRIDAGAGVGNYASNKLVVPTLEEYLKICQQKNIIPVIEIKTNVINDANYNELVKIVNNYGFGNNAKFISFYLEPLQIMKQKMPQISTMYLTGSINDTTIAQAKSIGDKSGLNVLWTSISADNVAKAKANGLTVGAWTVPSNQMNAMRNAGVDFITTDD